MRTKAERLFVRVSGLAALGRRVVMSEWQSFPVRRFYAQFTERLAATFAASGTRTDDALHFMRYSGCRSRVATEAMAEAGFQHCLKVAEGFEEPLDDTRQPRRLLGWKAEELPWAQACDARPGF